MLDASYISNLLILSILQPITVNYGVSLYVVSVDLDKFEICSANFRCLAHGLAVNEGCSYNIPK